MNNIMEKIKFENEECPSPHLLLGNHSYMGKIDKFIKHKIYSDDKSTKLIRVILNLSPFNPFESESEKIYNCYKYTNEFPIILDLVKKFFLISKNRYDIVSIDNEKYIIYEYEYEIKLSEYLNSRKKNSIFTIYEIKRIIAFEWLMCVKRGYSNIEDKIMVKSGVKFLTEIKECHSPIFIIKPEKNYQWDGKTSSADIHTSTINKWFDGDIENFYKVAKEICREINIDFFCNEVMKIVRLYNQDYIYWYNAMIEKFKFIKNYEI